MSDTDTSADYFAFITGTAGSDYLVATGQDTVINGLEGDDYIDNGGGNDLISGGAGDDVIVIRGGSNVVSGGEGRDTVVYAHLARSAILVMDAGSGYVLDGVGHQDTLTSVEQISFKDAYVTYDNNSAAASIARLYNTVLQRVPDALGLDSWTHSFDSGQSLASIANAFLNSAEFQAATGSLSNVQFVTYLYKHALGRDADSGGLANWTAALDAGASRADVLLGFSESAEQRALTADIVSRGLVITDQSYQQVAALYDTFAHRTPDEAGLDNWVGLLKAGTMTLNQVAQGFADSAEFQGETLGMTHGQLVAFLYQNTLHREPDAAGLTVWTTALDHGMSLGDLVLGFSSSTEHLNNISGDITGGIHV